MRETFSKLMIVRDLTTLKIMYKDKNKDDIDIGDEILYCDITYKITHFKVLMKGVQACGEHGCFPCNEAEKVEKEDEKPKNDLDD